MANLPIGVQVYSVRHEAEKDLAGTLAALKQMGYEGVEFAGFYGHEAQAVKKLLDDNGLICCGAHIPLPALLPETREATIAYNRTIGNPYLIVPGLGKQYTESREAWLKTVDVFNEISDALKPHGMLTGYHNHHTEFTPLDGELPWDTFFANTNKNVIMQLDTGNALKGGSDVLPFLERYPGRAVTVHLKDYAVENKSFDPALGDGDVPFSEIFRVCESTGGTKWYIVEYEAKGYEPLEGVRVCLEKLKGMGK